MKQYKLDGFYKNNIYFYGASVFSKNSKNFLINDSGCAILLHDDLVKMLNEKKIDNSLGFKLVQHGLAYVPGKHMYKCEKDVEVKYFIIDVTRCCNFDCIYCFRAFEEKRSISWQVLKDILNYIVSYCETHNLSHIGVQIWGGEPLLELEKITYIVKYFKKINIQASIDIETNASLVTDSIAKELYELGVHIGVSIDGTPELHDIQRKLSSGYPSFKLVERGIRHLQKYYGKDIGGITVVTKYSFQHINEILDYFIYRLGLSKMKFNLVRDNPHAKENKLALSHEEIRRFSIEMLEYIEAYRMLEADFIEGNVEIRAKNLLQRSGSSCCISHGCCGGKNIISFDYKGDIFPCELTDFTEEKIGSIYDQKPLDDQIRNAMQKNKFFLVKKAEKCENCSWWYYCRGGCSSRNRYLKNDGIVDEYECIQNHIIYPHIIEWILDRKII